MVEGLYLWDIWFENQQRPATWAVTFVPPLRLGVFTIHPKLIRDVFSSLPPVVYKHAAGTENSHYNNCNLIILTRQWITSEPISLFHYMQFIQNILSVTEAFELESVAECRNYSTSDQHINDWQIRSHDFVWGRKVKRMQEQQRNIPPISCEFNWIGKYLGVQ